MVFSCLSTIPLLRRAHPIHIDYLLFHFFKSKHLLLRFHSLLGLPHYRLRAVQASCASKPW